MAVAATSPAMASLKSKTRSNRGAGHGSQRRLVESLYLVAGLIVRSARDASSVMGVRPASRALIVARVTPKRAASSACVRPSRSRVSLYWVASISGFNRDVVDLSKIVLGSISVDLIYGRTIRDFGSAMASPFGGPFFCGPAVNGAVDVGNIGAIELGRLDSGDKLGKCWSGHRSGWFRVGVTQWQQEEGKTLLHKPQEKKGKYFLHSDSWAQLLVSVPHGTKQLDFSLIYSLSS